MTQRNTQRGDAMAIGMIVLAIALVAAVGFIAWQNFGKKDDDKKVAETTQDASAAVTRQLSRTYDLLNRLIGQRDAHKQPTRFVYDTNGNQTGTEDALGRVTVACNVNHTPLVLSAEFGG